MAGVAQTNNDAVEIRTAVLLTKQKKIERKLRPVGSHFHAFAGSGIGNAFVMIPWCRVLSGKASDSDHATISSPSLHSIQVSRNCDLEWVSVCLPLDGVQVRGEGEYGASEHCPKQPVLLSTTKGATQTVGAQRKSFIRLLSRSAESSRPFPLPLPYSLIPCH